MTLPANSTCHPHALKEFFRDPAPLAKDDPGEPANYRMDYRHMDFLFCAAMIGSPERQARAPRRGQEEA